MSRFFKSLCASLALAASLASAQDAAPATPAPKDKKPKQGYVRFWNLLPKEQGNLVLSKSDGSAQGEVLFSAIPLNNYSGYEPLPAARYALKVARQATPDVAVESFNLVLREEVYVTFLATLRDGQVKVELIDDTYDKTAQPLSRRLVIYHEFPGLRVVIAGARQTTRPLNPGDHETLQDLPAAPVELQMVATRATGRVENWSAEVDFARMPHASLVIVPDPYGRFRPRVSEDGHNSFATP